VFRCGCGLLRSYCVVRDGALERRSLVLHGMTAAGTGPNTYLFTEKHKMKKDNVSLNRFTRSAVVWQLIHWKELLPPPEVVVVFLPEEVVA
jgi:hypothetical protein